MAIAFPGETVRGTVRVTALYKSVPDLQSVASHATDPAIRTGFSAIDERIARCLAEIRGLVIAREITIGRAVVDGVTDEYRSRTEVTDFQDLAKVDPKTFEIPPGYRYEEPEKVIPPSGR